MATSVIATPELKRFVVDEGHGVKGVSDLKLKTLPELFIQPVERRLDVTKVLQDELIPVIDLSNYEDPEVMKSICYAAEKWGFFQIVNHGIPLNIIDGVKDATHKFFELSTDEKKKYSSQNSPSKTLQFLRVSIPKWTKRMNGKIT